VCIAPIRADELVGRISGRVVSAHDGEPLAHTPVALLTVPQEARSEYPYPWLRSDAGRPHVVQRAQPGADGAFAFDGLGTGVYQVDVDLADASSPVEVALGAGQDVEVELRVDLGHQVHGVVLKPDGDPAPGAEVFVAGVEDEDGGNASWRERPAMRPVRDDGTFRLVGLDGRPVWVRARHPDHGFTVPMRVEPSPAGVGVELVLRDELDRLFPLDREGFGGIGVGVEPTRLGPRITSVAGHGPARTEGVLPGDRIVAVDGLDTRFMPFNEFLMRCRGVPGTTLRLEAERDGEVQELVLVREAYGPAG